MLRHVECGSTAGSLGSLDSVRTAARAVVGCAAASDAFRRRLLTRLLPQMDLSLPPGQLRHLHLPVGKRTMLLSYSQQERSATGRLLVVALHDVEQLVRKVMPSLYSDRDGGSHMNVVDQTGRILYGRPIRESSFTVGVRFPATLYRWRLQVASI